VFTIRRKLVAGFLAVSSLIGAFGVYSYYQINTIDRTYSDQVERTTVIAGNAKDIRHASALQVAGLRGILLGELGSVDTITTAIERIELEAKETEKLDHIAEHKEIIAEIILLNSKFKTEAEKIIGMAEKDLLAAKVAAFESAYPVAREISAKADTLAQGKEAVMQKVNVENSALIDRIENLLLIVSTIVILLALAIGYALSQRITVPVIALSKSAKAIAEGDLTDEEITVNNKDELGELAASFNEMKKNIRHLVGIVRLNANHLANTSADLSASAEETSASSEQISISMQELASGTDKQVNSATEAVAASLEISKGMEQAASAVEKVASLLEITGNSSEAGSLVIQKAVRQMDVLSETAASTGESVDSLETKTNEIDEIVSYITEIASQTNLLALNASIEAARAGEHGKGFSVVAGEIRKLSEQSNRAADDIRRRVAEIQHEFKATIKSIHTSGDIVREGIYLVHEAGMSFEHIREKLGNITSEAHEVSAVTEQVNMSVKSMASMMDVIAQISEAAAANTQNVVASTEEQNAAMQEISATAENLNSTAQGLREAIEKFRI
jgi:methyl-accepting chemotaxis protein